jgi:hypothetical protein
MKSPRPSWVVPLLHDAQFWIPVVVLVAGVLVLEWVR